MRVGIIDADLIGRDKHRFPNLVCEKISQFHKDRGDMVALLGDYDHMEDYDRVYISKVFTDTWVPDWIKKKVNMETGKVTLPQKYRVGGTGFFFANAPNLPDEIEHYMPDYDLYNDWIEKTVKEAKISHDQKEEIKYQKSLKKNNDDNTKKQDIYEKKEFNEKRYRLQFKEYTDYSIGFMTRGCFRKCPFCVNQKYDRVFLHSSLEEFYNPKRKKICLLDDNFFGCPNWEGILKTLISTGKPFKFKQGIDERLLTEERCELLFGAKYDGDYTFAFDNISDYDLIHEKLILIRRHTRATNIKFYVLVGFQSTDCLDIINMWKRVRLLMQYQCLPYIMRYQNKNEKPWENSRFKDIYINMARWCNQPSLFKKMSFREFCIANQANISTDGKICKAMKALNDFEREYPDVAEEYFDLKFDNMSVIENIVE